MWLFTTSGFFSLTRNQQQPDMIQARARSHADIKRLREIALHLKLAPSKIISTPGADYPYRIIITPQEAKTLAAAMVADIDYANFKGEMQALSTQRDKNNALHEIWAIMRDWAEAIRRPRANSSKGVDWSEKGDQLF